MDNTIYSFLLTIFAGLSTMIGTIFIFLKTKKTDKIILSSLSFAAGVMSCVSIIELIPEGYHLIKTLYHPLFSFLLCLLFINVGVIVSGLIDHFMPDRGSKLYKIGIISMLAIILHNIPEDCSCYVSR